MSEAAVPFSHLESETASFLQRHGDMQGQEDVDEVVRPGQPRRRCSKRVVEGLILLFLVNVIWVAASEIVQVRFCPVRLHGQSLWAFV